jgi:hypothetical protein
VVNPSVMVATEPLGDANAWTRFAPGELWLSKDGAVVQLISTVFCASSTYKIIAFSYQ